MINPETLDLRSLPSVKLKEKNDLPNAPGIYFVLNSLGHVQYIGSSSNIKERWKNHHRRVQLQELEEVSISCIQVEDSNLLPFIEQALIEWFRPPLNGSKMPMRKKPLENGKLIFLCNLREILRQKNITIAKLHRISGVYRSTIDRLVKGINIEQIHRITTQKLMIALDCTFDDLWIIDWKDD